VRQVNRRSPAYIRPGLIPQPGARSGEVGRSARSACELAEHDSLADFLHGKAVEVVCAPFNSSNRSASFRSACNEHDECYATCGVAKADCDADFRSNLIAACGNAEDHFNRCGDNFSVLACQQMADLFHNAVANFGGGNYDAAQHGACICLPCASPLPDVG
jgi:hypothetical protein